MATQYNHLTMEERNEIQRGLNGGASQRPIARRLARPASTVTREIARNAVGTRSYDAAEPGTSTRSRRRGGQRKFGRDPALFERVRQLLGQGWSPQQIAGRRRRIHPDDPAWHVSHETIYCALYALPRGELIALLRKAHKARKPRARGPDRRSALPNITSIHLRTIEVAARQAPGHWEGDLIKGVGSRSSVGTLVERKSCYVILAKMNDASAEATLDAFTKRFRHVPECVRKALTYDQGREMARHETLAKRLKIQFLFADPHSPWQRPTNENTNGLIREYLPNGMELSAISQGYFNAIPQQLKPPPRRCLAYEAPFEVFSREIMNLLNGVALQP